MTPARRLAAWVVTIAALVVVGLHARDALQTGAFPERVDLVPLLMAAIFYTIAIALGGVNWHLILSSIGARIGLGPAMAVVMVAQAAKYLPGNVGHLIGRIGMTKLCGVSVAAGALSLSAEIGIAILGATLVSGAALMLSDDLSGLFGLTIAPTGLGLAILCAGFGGLGLIMALPFLRRRVPGLFPVGLETPAPSRLLGALAIHVAVFVLLGGMTVLTSASFPNAGVPFDTAIVVFTAAWLVGFLMPGAPGGLGVREAVLVTALTPGLGAGNAVALAVALRIVSILGDGLAFLVGWLLWQRLKPVSVAAAAPPPPA